MTFRSKAMIPPKYLSMVIYLDVQPFGLKASEQFLDVQAYRPTTMQYRRVMNQCLVLSQPIMLMDNLKGFARLQGNAYCHSSVHSSSGAFLKVSAGYCGQVALVHLSAPFIHLRLFFLFACLTSIQYLPCICSALLSCYALCLYSSMSIFFFLVASLGKVCYTVLYI